MNTSSHTPQLLSLLLVSLCAGALAFAAGDRWTPPPVSAGPAADLPRLSRTPELDGDLQEWAGTPSVPLRYQSSIALCAAPHVWNGPADASMELYAAWRPEGLCLAAVVTDDDVRNDREGLQEWEQDCLEIVVDGRAPGKLMTAPKSAGLCKFYVHPPVGDRIIAIHGVDPANGDYTGLKIGGRRTPTGYTAEILIPWTVFPDFTPKAGAQCGILFGLDDYDARDGDQVRPLMMSFRGIDNLSASPAQLIRWTLTNDPPTPGALAFDFVASLKAPGVVSVAKGMALAVEADKQLPRYRYVRLTARDADGNRALDREMVANVKTTESSTVYNLVLDWPKDMPDGFYTLSVELGQKPGRPVGTLTAPILYAASALPECLAQLEQLRFNEVVQTNPFRAAAYAAAIADVERLKRGLETSDQAMTILGLRGVHARLDILDDGFLRPDTSGLFSLVALGADPEAQVVVEFPQPGRAAVTFYWGAIPLATACVDEYATPQAAASADQPSGDWQGTVRVAGNRVIRVTGPVKAVTDKVADLVAAGKIISPTTVDALRTELVQALFQDDPDPLPAELRQFKLFCGDVHMHTFYSDGNCSPAGLVAEAAYSNLDFAVITDDNTLDGAARAQGLAAQYGLGLPIIMGQEVATKWAHFNAFPVRSLIPATDSLYQIVKGAHRQGAVIQWNHPGFPGGAWDKAQQERGLAGTGLDAWEHVSKSVGASKQTGAQPVVTGSTDTRTGTFDSPERTIILAPSTEADDLAEAVRLGNVVTVAPEKAQFLYGPERLTRIVWAALREGKALKAAKADALKAALGNLDAAAYVRASTAKPE